jgi:hypothetical protein
VRREGGTAAASSSSRCSSNSSTRRQERRAAPAAVEPVGNTVAAAGSGGGCRQLGPCTSCSQDTCNRLRSQHVLTAGSALALLSHALGLSAPLLPVIKMAPLPRSCSPSPYHLLPPPSCRWPSKRCCRTSGSRTASCRS